MRSIRYQNENLIAQFFPLKKWTLAAFLKTWFCFYECASFCFLTHVLPPTKNVSNTSSNIKVGQYYQYEKRLLCGFDTSLPIMRGFEMHTKLPTESWNFYEYITKVLEFQMESLTLCPVKKCKSLDLKI